jgi:multicomponent Na+:H+ antiporter subunit D
MQLLLFSGAFFALLPLMKRTLTITLDTDRFYRRSLQRALTQTSG